MSREIRQKRVIAIDLLRGISIFFMILAHVETYWLEWESFWSIGIKFLIIQIMGTSNFTFVAGISFAFSFQENLKKSTSRDLTIKKSLSRTIIMIILSLIFNVVQALIGGVEFSGLWTWNILQCIAICRLFGILIIIVSKYYRFLIAIIWVFLTEIVISWMLPRYEMESFARIIFLVFFNPLHGDGFLIFFPFFIFGTLIGEFIQNNAKKNKISANNKDLTIYNSKSLWKWFLIGLGLFIIGIIIGLKPTSSERDYYGAIEWLNTHPNIEISTLPFFILPNSYAWVFYCAGWQIMFAIVSFYIIDLKGHYPKPSNLFNIFGKYSLSIYIGHYLLLYIPFFINSNFSLNYINIWFYFIGFEAIFWGIFYYLDKKQHNNISLEFVIRSFSKKINSFLSRNSQKSIQ
jgi:hypothetical protein